jgi:hypothetical protein
MKFTLKDYKITKTKNYLKTNNLFFIYSGINQNSSNWIKIEQELKKINLNYYKIFNKTSTNIFKKSIYKNITPVINSVTFFIKPTLKNNLIKKKMLLNIETFFFLALKMNTKIYSPNQLKYVNSLTYYENKLLLYQFGVTHIKSYLNHIKK